MQLASFRVRLFRNIIDSGEVSVDEVTCLVGKNEAGKSALLQALHVLNPAKPPAQLNLLDEYPRWLKKEHEITGQIDGAVPITATFTLTAAEMSELQGALGAQVLTSATFIASRAYDSNDLKIEASIDYRAFIKPFREAYLPTRLAGELGDPSTVTDLRKKLAALASGDDGEDGGRAGDARDALSRLDEILGNDVSLLSYVDEWLRTRLPRTFYFSTYAQLDGRYDLDEVFAVIQNGGGTEEQNTAADFLNLARIEPAAAEDWNYEASNAELESVSSLLTKRVTQQWKQNDHLKLRVTIEPQKELAPNGHERVRRFLQFRVEDTRHDFSNRLDRRSTGFRWFVSFIASFLEFERDQNLLLLLDEPGLSLHARAQMDLLDTIEGKLAGDRQVIYSTHSPFMVRTSGLAHARITEDQGPDLGATVLNDAGAVSDPDTLFPLQAALGYDVVQSLFIGNRNVLVEGISDFIYITMISQHLASVGRSHLPDDCRLLPAGGATNIPTFIALLGTKLDFVVLLDGNTDRQRIASTIAKGRLSSSSVLELSAFSSVSGADIEDLFTPGEYVKFYNGAYGKTVKVGELNGSDRIVKRIERKEGPFNHGEVGAYFLRNLASSIKALSGPSLDRFETLIKAINGALR
jgi:energy-coupling factor transporter ATP-binding protein EcfA2